MITTWLQPNELEGYSHVGDKELDELFQEVRQEFPETYYIQTVDVYNKRLFRRTIVTKSYALYANTGHEYQCINFPPLDGTWSINTTTVKAMIMAYFFGALSSKNLISTKQINQKI